MIWVRISFARIAYPMEAARAWSTCPVFKSGSDGPKRSRNSHKLQRSARTSLQNTQQAVALAEQASTQLRAAEDKIARLDQEVWISKERAERAEAWLQRISQDIEQVFPSRQPDN
jgi:ribosomal protein S20